MCAGAALSPKPFRKDVYVVAELLTLTRRTADFTTESALNTKKQVVSLAERYQPQARAVAKQEFLYLVDRNLGRGKCEGVL